MKTGDKITINKYCKGEIVRTFGAIVLKETKSTWIVECGIIDKKPLSFRKSTLLCCKNKTLSILTP